ncbi:MAG: LUD domain-containing protein [Actinobacteria bacterium]|nr:LUD domain-containing protein [Actinomycetota bacterium]
MKPWAERYRGALDDPNVREGLLEFQRAWRESRDARIGELESSTGRSFDNLRSAFAERKRRIVADLTEHLARFRSNAERAGATVTQVATAREANVYIEQLLIARGADVLVKGKSMVSEEIGLNDHLAAAGIQAVETDLGEWLLQLAGEHPSHLVMPAIHKRRGQIAALLERTLGRSFDPDDIGAMVAAARTELRERFLSAGAGLSGANALIAESGTVMLVTNEGNNRLATSLPAIHVVVAGAEKLVATFDDAVQQVRLLARSATGQPITSYTTFVTGPRPGGEQHIVLIDNGRSQMAADPDVADALACIRCGACANVCPPYQIVGGHGFGHVYTGPIGLVNTPFHHSLADDVGPQSLCVSCGACAQVCPAEIPLPTQILEVRRRVVEEIDRSSLQRLLFRAYGSRTLLATAVGVAAILSRPFRAGRVAEVPLPSRHAWRTPPAVPWQPARRRPELYADERSPVAETEVLGRQVTLFLQCLTDRLDPPTAIATADLLRAAGAHVVVPASQHCCGLPAFDAGYRPQARRMAKRTIEALDGRGDVVTPAPSCVVMIKHDYERLFRDEPEWQARARRLAPRVHDLVSYLSGPARLPDRCLEPGPVADVTVHRFCQSGNVLGLGDEASELVERLCGLTVEPLRENGVCCGFGGTTSLGAPEVGAGILQRKLACADATGSDILVTDNPGCVLHLRGGAHASGRDLEVLHVAEFLARRLPPRVGSG